jgi:3',5'-cyclic AMP phosphodiesterase CpdA
MRLVLLGDIHMYRLFMAPWELAGKTLIGQANVWLHRRRHFDRKLLVPVVRRAMGLEPEMVLLSGDLTSVASSEEFERVHRILHPLISKVPTVAVPGNHDRYTFTSQANKRMERYFADAMPKKYPHLQPLTGRWHLLSMDSAVPRMFSSRGKLGKLQLSHAYQAVDTLTEDDGLLVMSHYAIGTPPPMPPMEDVHKLEDEAALWEFLETLPCPALYLHGHVHYPWLWHPEEPKRQHLVDVNAGAPPLKGGDFPFGQGFWEIELSAERTGFEGVKLIRHIPAAHVKEGVTELEWKSEEVRTTRVEIAAASGR